MAKSEQNSAVGAEGVDASSRDPQMIGDGMVGSSSDVNQGTTADGQRIGRGQSPRKSEETGNDRGAKGGRDVVWADLEPASHKGPGSAARLFARMRRNTGLEGSGFVHSGPPARQVSGAKANAAGTDSSQTWRRVPEPVHRKPRTGKPDAGEPPVRFGWRATEQSVLYPHLGSFQTGSKPKRARPACKFDRG